MADVLDRFISLLGTPAVVLDAGCGAGTSTREIAERGVEAVGIDVDAVKIAQAQLNIQSCIFRRMDARDLNYPTASYDGIWADTLFNHLSSEEIVSTLNGFLRVLKPHGILYLRLRQDAAPESPLNSNIESGMHSQITLLTQAGFKIVSKVDISEPRREDKDKYTEILVKRRDGPALQQSDFEESCLLCPSSMFSFNRQIELPSSGSILWGDGRLFLMPDIAPLVDGHLLLSTTKHYMCYGACPQELNPAIASMQSYIRALFAKIYQTPTVFMEHGPAQLKRAGICINHAHWHCLPTALPIQKTVESYIGPGQDASLETLQQMYQAGQSYIYIEEDIGKGRAYMAEILPSQFLRQITVSLMNRTDWEWQTSIKRPEIQEAFRRTLRQLIPPIDDDGLQA